MVTLGSTPIHDFKYYVLKPGGQNGRRGGGGEYILKTYLFKALSPSHH